MSHGVVAVVPARGGSRQVPRKNIADVYGRPLIAWTVDAGLRAASIDRVVVSTDDEEIAEAAREAGAEVPFVRPGWLATDEAGSVEVALHAVDALGGETAWLVLLQPTSPLRAPEDIDAAVQLATARNAACVSVCEASTHPHLCVHLDADLRMSPWIDEPAPDRRQDLEPAYAVNGAVYVIRPTDLREHQTFQPGGTVAYVMPVERSLDIDTPFDLDVARLLLGRRAETRA